MLKEAIEHIQETTQPVILEVEGRTFCVNRDGDTSEIRPSLDVPEVLIINSLDALVKMIKTEALHLYSGVPLYISVPDPLECRCYSQPNKSIRENRLTFYIAKATDVPGWQKETTMNFEEAMIALRTRFQRTADTDYALKLLSEITTGAKVTFNDNGIATTVVTQKGIALQGTDNIRPIVSLKPYRTFQEVEQPASDFLIRITDRGIKFVEADGGMWRLTARNTIKSFLEEQLHAEVESGEIVIAL